MNLINIVWFKKDLRIFDNKAIFEASKENIPTILIYLFEPSLYKQDDSSYRHFLFISQCVNELKKELAENDLFLNIIDSEVLDFFSYIKKNLILIKYTLIKKQEIFLPIKEICRLKNGVSKII
jgi:deoxyribodipyrimidine photo-lyase